MHNFVQDVSNMRKIFMIAALVGVFAFIYFLYQRQLGSIGFFVLSIYFFSLAVNQMKSKPTEENKKGKD